MLDHDTAEGRVGELYVSNVTLIETIVFASFERSTAKFKIFVKPENTKKWDREKNRAKESNDSKFLLWTRHA